MIEQLFIALFGVTGVFLSQSPNPKTQRYACLFGLAAQPAWFYATFIAGQYGMFALCFFYSAAWARGVKTHWLQRSPA